MRKRESLLTFFVRKRGDQLPSWLNKQSNLVFLGDACHPMLPHLGQGADSAVEDGSSGPPACVRFFERRPTPGAEQTWETAKTQGACHTRCNFPS